MVDAFARQGRFPAERLRRCPAHELRVKDVATARLAGSARLMGARPADSRARTPGPGHANRRQTHRLGRRNGQFI